MNDYWIVSVLLAILVFAIGETYAFDYPARQNTLSRAIYNLATNWPLSIWIMGVFAGGLAVHFFWHWCPAIGTGIG